MSDPRIDEQGCLHISIPEQRALLKSMGGLKASEHRYLLANGINLPEADPFTGSFALGTIYMRRRNPASSFDELQELVFLDFLDEDSNGDGEGVDAVAEDAVAADPPNGDF